MTTGVCAICKKQLTLGHDGACPKCGTEMCWECWMASGRKCSNCEARTLYAQRINWMLSKVDKWLQENAEMYRGDNVSVCDGGELNGKI